MKYSEWIAEWFDNYVKPNSKNKTIICYKSLIKNHIISQLGNYELEEITVLLIQKYITELGSGVNIKGGRGLSSNSINLIVTIIQESLRIARDIGLTDKYVADKIKRPRIKEKKVDCFTFEEQKKIEQAVLNHKKPKMFGIFLCLYTGLRIGELLSLEWTDIDFKKGELYVTKSCSDGKFGRITDVPKTDTSIRTIPLPNKLISMLKTVKHKNNSKYVVGCGEQVISVRSYQRSFELLLIKLGIPHKGFHSLRHTFATRAIEQGIDIKTLSELLGHKNPNVTLTRYAHSMNDHKKAMMNKLMKLF